MRSSNVTELRGGGKLPVRGNGVSAGPGIHGSVAKGNEDPKKAKEGTFLSRVVDHLHKLPPCMRRRVIEIPFSEVPRSSPERRQALADSKLGHLHFGEMCHAWVTMGMLILPWTEQNTHYQLPRADERALVLFLTALSLCLSHKVESEINCGLWNKDKTKINKNK